jgi:signal transduction histidine kinase
MTDLLGGTITLDSTIGAGTRFTLVFPRLAPSPAS